MSIKLNAEDTHKLFQQALLGVIPFKEKGPHKEYDSIYYPIYSIGGFEVRFDVWPHRNKINDYNLYYKDELIDADYSAYADDLECYFERMFVDEVPIDEVRADYVKDCFDNQITHWEEINAFRTTKKELLDVITALTEDFKGLLEKYEPERFKALLETENKQRQEEITRMNAALSALYGPLVG